MKFLALTLVTLMTSASFAKISSTEIDQLCLDLLIKESHHIQATGDVHEGELLADILIPASQREKYPSTVIENTCIKISYDGIYECKLFITATANGVPMGETYMEYAAWVGADQKPTSILNEFVEISRGH
ncbi:hypothetical protein [Bdellovibrio sp. KM01]|uniref:hypothetical protein n=1 Tax=Bdellovibrio sp. KM01 TaxID=2748865 RepID=UPI0015E9624A|nr:hypothetical protein [Bdellovibrio sp. KM01]QLY24914.1 hypothetical protein HW988_16010 [Bdellovibrio sp. KM01]